MNEEISLPSGSYAVKTRVMIRPKRLLTVCEDIFHYSVAFLLLTIGALVLYHTASGLLDSETPFAVRIVDSINGVLLGIIVLELMTTVIAHFEKAGLQLKPFLIIGIISAVRHILTIGARLTLAGELNGVAFRNSQIELGIESGVVFFLAASLLMVRRGENTASDVIEDE